MIRMPDPNSIDDETLLRLRVAAALEFPDGSVSAPGCAAKRATAN